MIDKRSELEETELTWLQHLVGEVGFAQREQQNYVMHLYGKYGLSASDKISIATGVIERASTSTMESVDGELETDSYRKVALGRKTSSKEMGTSSD